MKKFFFTGLLAFLPIVILAATASWVWDLVISTLMPIAQYLNKESVEGYLWLEVWIVLLVSAFVLLTGMILNTRLGSWVWKGLTALLTKLPGYKIINSVLEQFLSVEENKKAFSKVLWVKPYGNDTEVIGFQTEELSDGTVVCFVPTSPNPTSGFVFKLSKNQTREANMTVEQSFQVIIGCGKGL